MISAPLLEGVLGPVGVVGHCPKILLTGVTIQFFI